MSPATKRLLTEALEELDGCGCQFWACEGIGPTAATAIEGTKGRRLPGLKQKDLIGIPWSVAFALRADGWYLRSDIIWHKPNPMPESVTDRPTNPSAAGLTQFRRRWLGLGPALDEVTHGITFTPKPVGNTMCLDSILHPLPALEGDLRVELVSFRRATHTDLRLSLHARDRNCGRRIVTVYPRGSTFAT
jgi:hypothetical protein